ncbi:flagellar hook-associated protein FlgK [Bacillota bacterium Meth-B3]|nr:flagellar hook-associated protein FlgK [Christensenellaceae bacterium]MEA5065399.1 flagellar hook-associated protein FlgK [Eubacteriales bacterium]
MRPTFYGFEAARSGLTAAQMALDVTGHNIANLETPGYSRQLIEQSSTYYGSASDKLKPVTLLAGGIGVTVDGVDQARSAFLDRRFRDATSADTANQKTLDILSDIENQFDEGRGDGLNAMLEGFYKQLEVFSLNAGVEEYASMTRSNAQKVAQTFNEYSRQLDQVRNQTIDEMRQIAIPDANRALVKIRDLNEQIQMAKLQGNEANELIDLRGQQIDKLSGYIKIEVTPNHIDKMVGGIMQKVEDGTVDITVKQASAPAGDRVLLHSTDKPEELALFAGVTRIEDTTDINSIDTTQANIGVSKDNFTTHARLDLQSGGSLFGAIRVLTGKGSYHSGPGATYTTDFRGLPFYKQSLDDLANGFASKFNELNSKNGDLFSGTGAKNIAVTDEWLAKASHIVSSTEAPPLGMTKPPKGWNDNILRMVRAMDEDLSGDFPALKLRGGFTKHMVSLMGDVAIDVDYMKEIGGTSEMVLGAIDNQRESLMGVSLNEEAANLMKYQQAFSASARVMTALDEALDVLINRMGVVGR